MSFAQQCSVMPVLPRRILALFVVPLSIAFAVYAVFIAIVALGNAQQDWRTQAHSVFSRARAAKDVQARLDRDLVALKESPLWSRFYLSPTSGMGAMLLQTDVGALLARTQASTQSLAPIPSLPMSGFTRIGVRLSASMRIDQLKNFLAGAAAHQRYLRVEQLAVIAPHSQVSAENSPLAVTLEIYGFELKERPQ
jgi:hypothetical protein